MTTHRQIFESILLLMVSLALMSFKTADEQAAEALARRVMGSKAKAVVFEQTNETADSYELLQKGKKVLIRGNNANSMAVGLNRYIQQYCLANVSWYDFNPVELPKTMPKVPEKVSGKAEVPIRFFLNYCTFGYTMPWWKWPQWERFIDWMALNGVNMPLAITGQEAVWQKVWRKYGMTEIEGDYKHNAKLIAGTKAEGGKEFVGIGSTLEGFGLNEPVYEHMLSQAWDTGIGFDQYIDNIADRHLGHADANYRAFWHTMVDKVCTTHTSTGAAGIINAHPNLEGEWNWTTELRKGYDINNLDEALAILGKVEGNSNYLKFDLANTRRQSIRNRALAVRKRFTDAYKAGDRNGMVAASQEFLGMCDKMVSELKKCKEFSLDDWVRDARAWGKDEAEKDYFEMNARTIITVWGDTYHLADYANRDWDGLVETFYKVRWQMFFDAVLAAFDAGEPFVNLRGPRVPNGKTKEECERALKLDAEIWDFETKWAGIKK